MSAFFRRFGWIEFVVAALVFATLFALFDSYKLIRTDQMRGDSAMYLQGTQNLATRGVPNSQVQASIIDYLNHNRYTTTSADDVAKNPIPLFGSPTPAAESSIMLGHAYFILYPVSLVVKVLPVRPVLLALFVFSFLGMVLLAYFVLRGKGVSVAAACLFCVLAASHPAWWEGLLWGQFYPDRLFMLAGFAFMVLASHTETRTGKLKNRAWLVVAAVVCAAVNERGAIVPGIFLLLYVALYWKKPGLDRLYKLALGAVLLLYGLFAIKYLVPTDLQYSAFLPTSLNGLIYTIQLPRFFPLVTLFAIANLPLLCLAFFEWRAAAIAMVLMGPNVFGNIGGAEKTGWSTHYPTFFLPSLVWAALMGYSVLYRKAAATKRLPALYALTAVLIGFVAMLDPNAISPVSVGISNVSTSFLPTLQQQFAGTLFDGNARLSLENAVGGIVAAVPPHTVVSSVEAGMPLLYQDRTVEFFPKDIDNADYAVLGASVADGRVRYNGTVLHLGTEEQQKMDDLVVARMKRDGYDLEHPKLFPGFVGLAVVRRIHSR